MAYFMKILDDESRCISGAHGRHLVEIEGNPYSRRVMKYRRMIITRETADDRCYIRPC